MGELLSAFYDPVMAPLDGMGLRRWREWAISAAHGRVLEVGVGTGMNLAHYRGVESLAAIDPDEASLRRASAKIGASRAWLTLCCAQAEELPFGDESFDVVVGTLVFCTIGDPMRGLSEARRVLKTGGTFRLVEHVRVDNHLVAGVQDAMTPLWKQVADGCHLNRDTLSAVKEAGWRVRKVSRRLGGLMIGIDAVK